MSGRAVLVIDAGTSGARAVLVRDGEGTKLAREAWRTFVPLDASPFARELHAPDVRASLDRLLAAASPHREELAGIAVTGQREGVAFVDETGEALLVSPNVDGRAAMEGMALDARHGERIYSVTGHLPALLQAPAKLVWLRAHRPAVTARVRSVLPFVDWLGSLITGEQVMSRSLASEIGLLDISTSEVATSLLETLDFAPALLLRTVADGAVTDTARVAGLEALPVALCGADTQCALTGMGVAGRGETGIVAGWSTPVQMLASAPIMDAARRIWTGLHVVCGRWVLESNAGDCGRAWNWLCDTLSVDGEAADALAASAPAGSHDVVTVLGPPRMNAASMNVMTGGVLLPTPLAVSSPGRGDLLRSLLESAAYAVRANLEQLEEITGERAASIVLGGGMSRSKVFSRIVADVLARPVRVAPTHETSAVGAAAIASPALGLHATIEEAIDAATRGMRTQEPDMHTAAAYDDCYRRWLAIASRLEGAAL